MSAPRKIWASHIETEGAIERGIWADTIRQAPDGTLYYHDKVVRELIYALQIINGMPPFKPLVEAQRVSDAAIAKIAQEG